MVKGTSTVKGIVIVLSKVLFVKKVEQYSFSEKDETYYFDIIIKGGYEPDLRFSSKEEARIERDNFIRDLDCYLESQL